MMLLFIESDLKATEFLELSVFQTHYLAHVMRLKEDDEIICFNGRQGEWTARLSYVKRKAFLTVQKQLRRQKNLPECILCPALIKKEAMDFIWQKATELGATQIYPIIAERSVVKSFNQKHVLSVIHEACEQCERMDVPQVQEPETLERVLQQLQGKAYLIWLSERGEEACGEFDKTPAFFVGPEGGWSLKEQKLLKEKANSEWHFGQTILRSETACLSALAIYQAKKK